MKEEDSKSEKIPVRSIEEGYKLTKMDNIG